MVRWIVILCGCTAVSTAVAIWQTQPPPREQARTRPAEPESTDVTVYTPRTVLKNPIRPIVNPTIVSVDNADVSDNELIIGVEVGGAARAYPINQLTGPAREIINDTLGGTAIAATW